METSESHPVDRRLWPRTSVEAKPISLFVDGDLIAARMMDESLTGIGVTTSAEIMPRAGQQVSVQVGDETLCAIVRHVAPIKDGLHLGLEWGSEKIDPLAVGNLIGQLATHQMQ